MEREKYYKSLEKGDSDFEAICKRCGECCGASDDPCVNLTKIGENHFICIAYERRLGPQKTVSGSLFNCVPIREHIAKKTVRPNCTYRSFC